MHRAALRRRSIGCILVAATLFLVLQATVSIAAEAGRGIEEIRGQRLSAVASLPGALALSDDGRLGFVITPARKVLRLDLERLVTQPLPFDGGTPSALALDPFGRWLAIGTEQQRVVVVDATSGAVLHSFNNNLVAVNVVAFSPDGRWLAAGDRDARVFEPATGWRALDLVREPARRQHGATIVWETVSWKRTHTFDAPAGAIVTALAFDHPASQLVVGEAVVGREGIENRASIWDLATGQLQAEMIQPAAAITTQYFSSLMTDALRGVVLANGVPGAMTIEQISIKNYQERSTLTIDARFPAEQFSIVHRSRNASRLILARHDAGELAVIHAGTGMMRATLSGLNERSRALALASDAHNDRVYAITADGMLWRWKLPTVSDGDNAWTIVATRTAAVMQYEATRPVAAGAVELVRERRLRGSVLMSPDEAAPVQPAFAMLALHGNRLLVKLLGNARQAVELRDITTGKSVCKEFTGNSDYSIPSCPAPGTDGGRRYFLTRSPAQINHDVAWRYAVVDGIFRRELWSQTLLASDPSPQLIEFGPETFVLANTGRVQEWNAGTARVLYENPDQSVLALAPDAPRNRFALYAGLDKDRHIRLFDLASGKQRLVVELNKSMHDVKRVQDASLMFSVDGNRLLVRERGLEGDREWDSLVIVDVAMAKVVHASQIRNDRLMSSGPMVLHIDGAMQWRAGLSPRPNRLRVDGLGPDRKTQDFGRHRLFADVLAISATGRWVASGGADGSVKLWDRASGTEAAAWQGPHSAVAAITFDGDARLAMLYHDGQVDVLAIASRQGASP